MFYSLAFQHVKNFYFRQNVMNYGNEIIIFKFNADFMLNV